MAEVTGLTAAAMIAIRDNVVVDGAVDGSGHLILERYDGTTFDAGALIAATGVPFVGQYTTVGRPSAVGMTGKLIWDITLSDFYKSDGSTWILEPMGGGSGSIDDSAYDAAVWLADTTGGASRKALRNKIEAMIANTFNLDTAQSVTAGIKKTFASSGTTAGLRLLSSGADPSARATGDMWYNGTVDRLKYAGLANVIRELVNTAQAQTLLLKTLVSPVLDTGVSGTAIDTDPTLSADSDTLLASQKAVRTLFNTFGSVDSGTNIVVAPPVAGVSLVSTEPVFASKAVALYARQAANQSVTSSTVLVDSTNLQLALVANAVYEIECFLILDAGTAGDIKVGFARTGAGTWTFDWTPNAISAAAASYSASVNKTALTLADTVIVPGVAVGTKTVAHPKGLVITDATAGTFKVQFAQNASDGTATTLYAGSYIKARRLA